MASATLRIRHLTTSRGMTAVALLSALVATLVAAFVLVIIVLLIRRARLPMVKVLPGPPTPSPWLAGLLVGHFAPLFGGKTAPVLLRWVKQYGLLVQFQAPLQTTRLVICDPVVLKDMCVLRPYTFPKPDFLVTRHSCAVSFLAVRKACCSGASLPPVPWCANR